MDLLGYISDDWLKRAKEALKELKALPASKRSRFIEENSDLWSEIKDHLARISFDKCWYSEKRLAPSESEVDHFRPKSRVSKSKLPHKGYWWLAFAWENFRLAYSLVNKRRRDRREGNTQGKGCRFPLLDEDTRVPDSAPGSTDGEAPELIDPCVMSDIRLLNYAIEDGKVIEKFTTQEDATKSRRATTSIDLYHLNEGTLIRDRKELQVAISRRISEVERLTAKIEKNVQLKPDEEKRYQDLLNELGECVNSSSQFSAFARACLLQQGNRGWNMELLKAA
jgi:hypothetical protein